MGAANVSAAYRKYAGRIPPASLSILVYMATISKDSDQFPWFGLGHEALAEFALGRAKPNASDLRMVRRYVKPLADIGAISVERRQAPRREGGRTVRYRLHLDPE